MTKTDLASLGPPSPRAVEGAGQTLMAFEVFFAEQYRPLVSVAYALSGSLTVAEDVAQEALMAAYRRWDELCAAGDPTAWVRRVTANQSVSFVRRRTAEARALVRLGGLRTVAPELSETTQDVWRQVRRLPRRQAQAVALFYLFDLPLEQVAELLECSPETVRTHLKRARSALAVTFETSTGDDDER